MFKFSFLFFQTVRKQTDKASFLGTHGRQPFQFSMFTKMLYPFLLQDRLSHTFIISFFKAIFTDRDKPFLILFQVIAGFIF